MTFIYYCIKVIPQDGLLLTIILPYKKLFGYKYYNYSTFYIQIIPHCFFFWSFVYGWLVIRFPFEVLGLHIIMLTIYGTLPHPHAQYRILLSILIGCGGGGDNSVDLYCSTPLFPVLMPVDSSSARFIVSMFGLVQSFHFQNVLPISGFECDCLSCCYQYDQRTVCCEGWGEMLSIRVDAPSVF